MSVVTAQNTPEIAGGDSSPLPIDTRRYRRFLAGESWRCLAAYAGSPTTRAGVA